jgi:hypothetical protein
MKNPARRAIALAVVAIALVAAPQATAATRLGPDLTVKPCEGQSACFAAVGCQSGQYSPCSYVNLHSTSSTVLTASPSSGVITRWRFRAGCCTENETASRTLTLKTFKPGTQDGQFGYSFIVPVNTGSSFVIPPGNQLLSDPFVELPARLPIAAGERVGIVADHPISFAVYNPSAGVTSTVVANNTFYNGEAYGNPMGNTALAISVDIEPDADGDDYGDETQDCAPADPSTSGGCQPPPSSSPVTPAPVYQPGPCVGICGGGGASPAVVIGPIGPAPGGDGSVVYVPLSCPPTAVQPCGGFLVVVQPAAKKASASRKPKVLARARFLVSPGESERIRVKLSKAGRKLLRRERRLRVVISIRPNEGEAVSVRRTLKWRGARRR